jgi:tripartite-type tricarboxylate transporter receptor subunit TctC
MTSVSVPSASKVLSLPVILLLLAACSSGASDSAEGRDADASAECESFPSEDISLIVPFSPGGGFDAWARLLAPYMEEHLGGDASILVENQPGGGGMRGVNSTFSRPPDGTTLLFTEPSYVVVNQVIGEVEEGFDVAEFTYLGTATIDPLIYLVSGDSAVESMDDLADLDEVRHARQEFDPADLIVYEAFGIEESYILHEGSSEAVLSVQRGDAHVTQMAPSSALPYMESGELKPILFVASEGITDDVPGYEQLQGVQTAADAGHEDLGALLEVRRVLAAAPGTPDCIADPLAEAFAATMEDEEFLAAAEKADLRAVYDSADATQEAVRISLEGFSEYGDQIRESVDG